MDFNFIVPVSRRADPEPDIPEDQFPLISAERFLRENAQVTSEAKQALGGVVIAACLVLAIAGYFFWEQSIFFSVLFLLIGASAGVALLRKGIQDVDALHEAYLEYLARHKPEEVREMADIAEGNGWRATTYRLARKRLDQLERPSG